MAVWCDSIWKVKKIGFIGVIIGPNGIEIEGEKVDRVLSWLEPKCHKLHSAISPSVLQ